MSRAKARGATRQQKDQFQVLLQGQEDHVWPKLGTGHRHATYQRILLEGVTRAEYAEGTRLKQLRDEATLLTGEGP